MTDEVLEENLDRDRQRREVGPAGHRIQSIEVGQAGAETGARAEGIGGLGRGRHDAPPSSTALSRGVSRRRAGAPAPGRGFAASIRRLARGHPPAQGRWLHSTGVARTWWTRSRDDPGSRAVRAWGDLPGDDPERDRAE